MKLKYFALLFGFFISSAFAEHPAQRIVSLAPSLTELAYSAGAGHLLVGAVSYSNYPKQALNLPKVGNHNGINFERLIALNPDLILVWQSGNRPQDIKRLKELGFHLLIRDTQNLSDIPNLISEIGQKAGTLQQANKEASRIKHILQHTQQTYQNKQKISVFYQIWDRPLITIGQNQFISQAIGLCGGNNIFNDVSQLAPQVSVEEVLKRNPQVMLLGGQKHKQTQWQQHWQRFPNLAANQHQQIHQLNADLFQRPTARLINALPDLCQTIHQARP